MSNIPFESLRRHGDPGSATRVKWDNVRLWALPMAIFLFIHATFARQMTLIARES